MNPRERVLTAISHGQPDRVPCDFWAEEPTWRRLLEHVGHDDRDRLLDELEVDVRHLDAPTLPERAIGGGVFQNFWGERYVYQATPWGPMREDVRGALADATSLSELESFAWPHPDQFDYSALSAQCRRWENHALLYGFADIWQRPGLVRGWEGMFVDMLERPEWVHFLSRTFTDFYKLDYTRAAEATGGRIDLYLLISDLGSQAGPLISLDMFRQFVAPYLREMIDCIHGLGGKVLYHSCGSIRPFIPDLIALGVDVLDPIQPTGPRHVAGAVEARVWQSDQFSRRHRHAASADPRHAGTGCARKCDVTATCWASAEGTSSVRRTCFSPTCLPRIFWPCIARTGRADSRILTDNSPTVRWTENRSETCDDAWKSAMPYPKFDRFAVRMEPLANRDNKKCIEQDHVSPRRSRSLCRPLPTP